MNQENLIEKIGDSYRFTDSGELTAYFYTAKKLLHHYMLKKQALEPSLVQEKLGGLQNFLSENFTHLDDYLNKLNLIADYVNESDIGALSGFFGKQFLAVLEQTKKQLFEREIPKYRERFENPFRTPSHQLLEMLGSAFMEAEPLLWPPPSKPGTKKEINTSKNDMAVYGPTQTQSMGNREEGTSKSTQASFDEESFMLQKMPGVLFLELHEEDFMKAEPLSLPLKSELIHQPPDEEMEKINTLPQQITFKEYAQLSNKISQFAKNKDNTGYQNWLVNLEYRLQTCVLINQLAAKEKKGQKIDWKNQIYAISDQYHREINQVKKVKNEVITYQETIRQLHLLLRGLPNDIRELYPQFVLLLSKQEQPENKKTALKIALLQINNEELKEKLLLEISKLIDKLEL